MASGRSRTAEMGRFLPEVVHYENGNVSTVLKLLTDRIDIGRSNVTVPVLRDENRSPTGNNVIQNDLSKGYFQSSPLAR